MLHRALFWSALTAVMLLGSAARAEDREDVASLKRQVQTLQQRVESLERQLAGQPEPSGDELDPDLVLEKKIAATGIHPQPIDSTGLAVDATTPLEGGQLLQVEQAGQWWAARIVRLLRRGNVTIHYVGWEDSWDEVVPRTRLQLDSEALTRALATVVGPAPVPEEEVLLQQLAGGPITPSEIPVTADELLRAGRAVQIEWHGTWWLGAVLAALPDETVVVHYVGWSNHWDETVPRSRLRLPAEGR